jgi:mycothiol synthase
VSDWRFLDYRRFRRSRLLDTIRRTYEDTLDCPRLTGVRSLNDVLASHRAAGIYQPKWWWLALRNGEAAGCILVNAAKTPFTAEIVYMGAAKEFRGKGLGIAMLQHARRETQREGVQRLRLSVDANNVYAKRLYERFGFVKTGRKRCFALLPTEKETECE